MDDFTKRLVHLHHCKGIGWKTIYYLLKSDPELKSLYHINFEHLYLQNSSSITALNDLHSDLIHEKIRQYFLNDIRIITIFDEEYPPLLKETYQPPWVIYAKGDIRLLKKENLLAVVGSRQYTEYGENAIKYIIPKLIEKGIVIVSGLAMGIDAIAHHAAIQNNGHTIGVIAGGLFHIYPNANKNLAAEMMKNQLLISEYPPYTKPDRWQFPMRNRIISGISKGTFIVQAKRKSGSLITANYAVQEGREVFALPGSIFSPYSIGTNELLQQGAKLVNTPDDILEELIY
ncbi:DNA-processing protein DprA [Cytobacillus praedii]|uniref:DNA-protecting protein DprA n=1 Tax=Cytobacillus praedii TaxID=1742358 RepID=A0A4R1B3L9_9BACI|nr:DNA-processing protein DprA [Cytobacillus praedii]MED3552204.1 DNA-processing protein DprA [Cytobacillus praedii]TCJ06000.1 DNA-protecting protein DprA [Cytobacillus praedii]